MVINNVYFSDDVGTVLTTLQAELRDRGILLLNSIKDTPDNVMISCPYHKNGQERRPSAGIRKSDGLFHCFACGETHSLPEVISYCLGYTDDILGKRGLEWLLKKFVTLNVEERSNVNLNYSRDSVCDAEPVTYVTELELDSYRYIHPYMYKRKLTDSIIDFFDIGYDSATDCITFPVRDITGQTLFIARRNVRTKFFNYPNGVEKPVYGLYEYYSAFSQPEFLSWDKHEVIICESMIDALTCWTYGKYAVALNGLGNELQFRQLNSMPCRKFILATDMDNAGRRARNRIRRGLKNKIITEYVWDESVAKDINDMDKQQFMHLSEIF